MAMNSVKERAQSLLTLVEALVEMPGLTWVAASNAVFSPGGPFWHLFRAKPDRVAFGKTKEGRRIDKLIMSLPTPPVRPAPKEPYDPTRVVEIIELSEPRESKARKRRVSNGKASQNGTKRRRLARSHAE